MWPRARRWRPLPLISGRSVALRRRERRGRGAGAGACRSRSTTHDRCCRHASSSGARSTPDRSGPTALGGTGGGATYARGPRAIRWTEPLSFSADLQVGDGCHATPVANPRPLAASRTAAQKRVHSGNRDCVRGRVRGLIELHPNIPSGIRPFAEPLPNPPNPSDSLNVNPLSFVLVALVFSQTPSAQPRRYRIVSEAESGRGITL